MNAEQLRMNYIDALMQYIKMEYFEDLPDTLSQEMVDYMNGCFDNLTCYPNASGRFCELFQDPEGERIMSMIVKDVIDWLRTLPADDAIYIDEGGLNLMSELTPDAYLEVGGQALEDEEDEDDSIFEDEEDENFEEINEGDDDEWDEDEEEDDDWGDDEEYDR
jgi:hypothetical protein